MKIQVVIDVEMCKVQMKAYNYPYKNEIIQIGAVKMDEKYEILDSFSTYVKPRYGKIDHFIDRMTGISERNLKGAPDIEDALLKMLQWIGDDEAIFYSWSTTDYNQIRNEIRFKCRDDVNWGLLLNQENWIDYQERLGARLESPRSLKLSDALELVEIDTKGRAHDGLDDAYNTACMIAKLEQNKDYKTLVERLRANEENQKPLTTSLGQLLQGLSLEPDEP